MSQPDVCFAADLHDGISSDLPCHWMTAHIDYGAASEQEFAFCFAELILHANNVLVFQQRKKKRLSVTMKYKKCFI